MFSQPQGPRLAPHPTHCTSGKRTAISPDWVIYLTHGRDGYCNWCAQGALVSGAYQLNKLNKDTTHQGRSTGQRSVPAVRRLPLCSETLVISRPERVKIAESRAMRDFDLRKSMPKLQARHAKERQRNREPIAKKEKAHVPLVL